MLDEQIGLIRAQPNVATLDAGCLHTPLRGGIGDKGRPLRKGAGT